MTDRNALPLLDAENRQAKLAQGKLAAADLEVQMIIWATRKTVQPGDLKRLEEALTDINTALCVVDAYLRLVHRSAARLAGGRE